MTFIPVKCALAIMIRGNINEHAINKLLIFNVITDNTFYKSSILLMLFKNTRVEIQMLHLETECISQICCFGWMKEC